MKHIIFILLVFISSTLLAKGTCAGEDKETPIFKYAISQFGKLTKCHRKVTSVDTGEKFHTMTYVFKNCATLTMKSAPPEVTDIEMVSEKGFAHEAETLKKLKNFIASIPLKIDWSKSESYKEKGRKTKIFRASKEQDINGWGRLIYKGKKLVGIGYGMAL